MERAPRVGSSKGMSLPGGKENVPPSESRIPMRRKLPYLSDVRRARFASSSEGEPGHALLAKTLTAKRAPFRVHCDDKNSAASRKRAGTPLLGSADEKVLARCNDRGQLEQRRSGHGPRVAPRKRLASGGRCPPSESRNDGKPRPSGIPRPLGSATPSTEAGWESRIAGGSTSAAARNAARNAARKATTTTTTWSPRARDPDGGKRWLAVPGNDVQGARVARSRSTERPADGASPPIRAICPKEAAAAAAGRSETKAGSRKVRPEGSWGREERDACDLDLLYHTEYNDDLAIVEREREERSPRLSDGFLSKHINAEQRRLMVAFMLHLGMHCRYPSFAVYRSVKLFDAAMDRIRVETAFIQMSALACLWIALKNLDLSYKIPTATTMVGLAKEQYVGMENLLMAYERRILQALNFNVTFADVFALYAHHLVNCRCYVQLSDEAAAFLYNCGCYVIDVTLLDEKFCQTSVNLVAVSAIELALGVVLDTEKATAPVTPRWMFWRGLLFAAIPRMARSFPDEEIDKIRIAMLRRVLHSERKHCGFDIVYSKYSRSRNGRISKSFLERVNRLRPTETVFDV